MDYRLRNLFFLDIETVSAEGSFDKLSPAFQALWVKKASTFRLGDEDHSSTSELYFKKAGIYAEFGKIVTVAISFIHPLEEGGQGMRVKSFTSHDEKSLLEDLKDFFSSQREPEAIRLCGHNAKEFDFPYLSRRMLVNGIRLPYVLDNSGKKPWEVNFLDTMEMWKFGDRKNYTSLDLLTEVFGIPSSKDSIDGSMVNDVYYRSADGLQEIERYCQKDTVATAQLYLKMKALPTIQDENITVVYP